MSTVAKRLEWIEPNPATDPRWVLEDDVTMPESDLHDDVLRLLVEILDAWVQRLGRNARVRRNLALRWDRQEPRVGVDPDVMLIEPAPPGGATLRSLCTWKAGHVPPRLAIEVVSDTTAAKDYGEGPAKYAVSGTHELCVFDPEGFGPKARGGPFVLQVWRRSPEGRFIRHYVGDGPAYSEQLGAWLVVTDQKRRLRIADDREGHQLWLTVSEAALRREEAERIAREAERVAKEAALKREEAERVAKEVALAENEQLRAEIARLRGE